MLTEPSRLGATVKLKIAAGLLLVVGLSGPAPVAADGTPWQAPLEPNPLGTLVMRFLDKGQARLIPPASFRTAATQHYEAVLPACASSADIACIESVESSTDDGKTWDAATPSTEFDSIDVVSTAYLPTGKVDDKWELWNADPAKNLVGGSRARVFTLPKAAHAGGDQYLVTATVSGGTSATATLDSLDVSLAPVQVANGDCATLSKWPGYCPIRQNFPANVTYRVTLRMGSFLGAFQGWFQGRLAEPVINQNDSAGTVSFQGKPVAVSVAKAVVGQPIPPKLTARMFGIGTGPNDYIPDFNTDSNQMFAMQTWRDYTGYTSETAEGETPAWRVTSIPMNNMFGADPTVSRCLSGRKGVTGVMTTNATIYDSTPPTWNSADQSLSYQVAAPHNDSTGKIISGIYNLMLTSDVAKCLWGKNAEKATASISILDSAGAEQTAATVTLNNRAGWVHFVAAGFHYSAEKISVALKVPAEEPPAPTPTPTPTKPSVKPAKTITCVKGKTVKKVTTSRCPAGFKKR